MSAPAEVIAAVERGWSVIPCGADKRPLLPTWKPYQQTPPTRLEVEQWAASKRPASWAVVTGSVSGVVVLDFDGEPGRQAMQAFELHPNVETPSGGTHVYVEHPGHKVTTVNGKSSRTLGEQLPNLDVRGDGGYAIFNGRNGAGNYRLIDPTALPTERLPDALRSLLGLDSGSPTALTLLERALAGAVPGCRNDQGLWLAAQLRDNGNDQAVAEATLATYAARVPEGDHAYTESEAIATVKSAYSRAAREPWSAVVIDDDDADRAVRLASEDAASFLNREFFTPIGLRLDGARRIGEQRGCWLIDLRNTKTGELHERIDLGHTSELTPEKMRNEILEATGAVLERKGKAPRWDLFRKALHEAAVLEKTGGEAEETREWLSDFVAARRWNSKGDEGLVDMDDKPKLAKVLDAKHDCFVGSNGSLYVRLPELVKYVTHICGARTTNRDLAKRLYALGFQRDQTAARVGDRTFKGRYFRSGPGFDADA